MSEKKKMSAVEMSEPEIVAEDLEIGGSIYATTLPPKYKNRKPYRPIDPNQVVAFMPGTVRKFFVAEGDTVAKGDKLLVLDAMKMNNELLAPADGVVTKIAVKVGESVPKHALLVALKTARGGVVPSGKKVGKPAQKTEAVKKTASQTTKKSPKR